MEVINKINSPIKEIDEYAIFSNSLNILASSQSHQHLLSEWFNSLNPNEQAMWNDLLHIRRIKVEFGKKMKFDVPRRIVKIKKSE